MAGTHRIESVLITRLLHGKRWLDYIPAERGRRYRALREWVLRHPVIFGLLGSAALGLIARLVVPLFVPGFWSQLSTGDLGHLVNFAAGAVMVVQGALWLDRQLHVDPDRFAAEHFRKLAFPWLDAYDSIAVADKAALDAHVFSLRHMREVPDELTYGIFVAKIADVLAESSDAGTLRGLDKACFIEMMRAQKLDPARHQELMEQLFERRVSPEALAAALDGAKMGGMAADPEVLEMLRWWVKWGTYQLRIDVPRPLQHLGSQLSRGYLDLRGDVGQNALSYLGKHSEGADFPIALIVGDAGASLATSASRGLVYCTGDVGDDCGKGMTGGTIVVGGRPGNRFGYGMDDSSYPAVLVAYRAIDGYLPEESIRGGLVLLLNRDVDAPPRFLRFTGGAVTELPGTTDAMAIYQTIVDYVLDWRSTHDVPIPSELAGEGGADATPAAPDQPEQPEQLDQPDQLDRPAARPEQPVSATSPPADA